MSAAIQYLNDMDQYYSAKVRPRLVHLCPPPNDNSAHALLRGLSDPALSLSGIGGISGSEGEDYLMITET